MPQEVAHSHFSVQWLADDADISRKVNAAPDEKVVHAPVVSTSAQQESTIRQQSAGTPPRWTAVGILSGVWVTGVALLLFYAVVSHHRVRRRVETAVRYQGNIFQSENVSSPFVLGVVKPKIYLPYKLDSGDMPHVVAHEQAHIQRKDHWWKPLGFVLLAIHWFNPLMWLAYRLLCRDIELACDEKVVWKLSATQRADYAQALMNCSVRRAVVPVSPLAFGEIGVKERVESVMNTKKPSVWRMMSAMLACAVVAVCFLTNPVTKTLAQTEVHNSGATQQWFDFFVAPEQKDVSQTTTRPEYPDVTFQYTGSQIVASKPFDDTKMTGHVILVGGTSVWNAYFLDLFGDDLPEICATYDVEGSTYVTVCDYATGASYTLQAPGVYDYTLWQNAHDGKLYVNKRDHSSGTLLSMGQLVFAEDCLQIQTILEKDSAHGGYVLTVMQEDIYTIEVSLPDVSGGCLRADGMLFESGTCIALEILDGVEVLDGMEIAAKSEDGQTRWHACVPEW